MRKILNKRIWGGMLADKYFISLDDGSDIQVPFKEWEKSNIGDEYPKSLQVCHQCGKEFTTNEVGVTHHININEPHSIDCELDQDHTPYEL